MSEVKERNQQRREGTEGQGHWKQGGRGGLGHFTFLELFYCGLILFFAREVWPVILHAHGPEIL